MPKTIALRLVITLFFAWPTKILLRVYRPLDRDLDSPTLKAIVSMEISVIVPTFNECDNIMPMLQRLDAALQGLDWEVIFVDDDSPDQTVQRVRELAQHDSRVRCLQRIGRRGLSSAVIEGILSSSAPACAVIDGDLQHDETLLPSMLSALNEQNLDVVSGSRYMQGGDTGDWSSSRLSISRFAIRLSRSILKSELTDPMSGFFIIRRTAFEACVRDLSGLGFKILLDIFASSKTPLRYLEVPYTFKQRHAGDSKLDSQVAVSYLMMLMDKLIGRFLPVRFVLFAAVGGVGLIIHLLVVWGLLSLWPQGFVAAQALATLVAMTSNFSLNNSLTYRDQRLRGWAWLSGLVSFYLACSIGAVANIGIASYVFSAEQSWVWASLAGILVGAVWNYAVTAIYTWKRPKNC